LNCRTADVPALHFPDSRVPRRASRALRRATAGVRRRAQPLRYDSRTDSHRQGLDLSSSRA